MAQRRLRTANQGEDPGEPGALKSRPGCRTSLPHDVHQAQEQYRSRKPLANSEHERPVYPHLHHFWCTRDTDTDGGGGRGLGTLLVHLHKGFLVYTGEVQPCRAYIRDAVEVGPAIFKCDPHTQRCEIVVEPAAVFQLE